MTRKKVTMQTIADQLNVSKVTVHKALNGKSDISDKLRETILQKSIDLGYENIDPLAKHCRNFFFLISKEFYHSSEQYYRTFFNKLSTLFDSYGIRLELKLIENHFDATRFADVNKRFLSTFGVYIAGPSDKRILQNLADAKIPVVAIDCVSESANVSFLFIDNYRAGYKLTNYLIETGHKNICAVIDTTKSSSNLDKFFGFRKSLEQHGIQFKTSMHISADFSKVKNIVDFQMPSPLPDAFIFDCDYAAYNFYICALSHSISIPYDVSVAAFDNTELCLDMSPQLTSIGPDVDEIVQKCHDAMLTIFERGYCKNSVETIYSLLHKRPSVKTPLTK